jgi:hypothetical protein
METAYPVAADQFDHCVFAVEKNFPREVKENWLRALFSMSYENPKHREMMDMEGLEAGRRADHRRSCGRRPCDELGDPTLDHTIPLLVHIARAMRGEQLTRRAS